MPFSTKTTTSLELCYTCLIFTLRMSEWKAEGFKEGHKQCKIGLILGSKKTWSPLVLRKETVYIHVQATLENWKQM